MSNIPQGNSTTHVNDALAKHLRMWNRLRNDMRSLKAHDCKALDPSLVIRFMDYIEEVETSWHRTQH